MKALMEIKLLQCFVIVAEELHFTKAAARLGIAQPALSQQVQKLERDVGEALFHRGRRRAVELTAVGQVLLPHATRIVRDAATLPTIARQAALGEAGFLSVGFTGGATYALLPAAVREFRRRAPTVELELADLPPTRQVEMIEARQMHVGLVRASRKTIQERPQLRFTVVQREPFAAALPENHRLAAERSPLPLADLAAEPFLMYGRTAMFSLTELVTGYCLAAGFRPRVVQEVAELQTILSLVEAEVGVALVPASAGHVSRPGVVLRPMADPSLKTELLMVSHRRETSPTAQLFQSVAREVDKAAPETRARPPVRMTTKRKH